jgi:hypothetical protein
VPPDDDIQLSSHDIELTDDDPVSTPRPARSRDVDPLGATGPADAVDDFTDLAPPDAAPFPTPVSDDPLENAPTRVERQDELSRPDSPPAVKEAHLAVIGGNDRGRQYPLEQADTSIGRGLENDVVLADISVSRKHTLVCFEAGRFVVRDLGSGNGTLVNGQRVHTHLLRDGDQIELGNTLIRFVFPSDAVPAGAAASHPSAMHVAAQHTMDVRRDPQLIDTSQAPAAVRRKTGGLSSRSRKLLTFGTLGLVLLFAAMLGVRAMLGPARQPQPKTPPKPSPDEIAAKHFEEGTKQYRARNWEAARKHYHKVLAVAPGFDQAKRYADQAMAEMEAREALQRAKNAAAAKDYTVARQELSQVQSTSVYAAASRRVKQQIDDEQVQQLLESARLLKDSGDRQGALAKVTEARKIAPTNQAIRELQSEIEERRRPQRPTVTRPRPPRSTKRTTVKPPKEPGASDAPIRAGKGARSGLALYRKRQWGPAYQSLKAYAGKQSGKRQEKANALAETVRRVGQALLRAQQVQARSPDDAFTYYKEALKHDQQIPGKPQQSHIRKLLFKVARMKAAAAVASGKYEQAFKAVKQAKRYGRPDAALNKVTASLENKANQIFEQAYTVRQKNPKKARSLWQRVLKIVPPNSTAYQKAYSWLNNATPSYMDEDEE